MKNSPRGFVGALLLVIIAALLIGGGVYAYDKNKQTNQPVIVNPIIQATSTAQTENSQTSNSSIQVASTSVQLQSSALSDQTWNLYTNSALGFSVEIPKSSGVNSCDTKPGIPASQIESPVKVFVDTDGTATIANEYLYVNTDSVCKKVTLTLPVINEGLPVPVPSIGIVVAQANNDSDINNFLREGYAHEQDGCTLNKLATTSEAGTFDVIFDRTGADGGCFINSNVFVKYSPNAHKIARLGTGQDVQFTDVTGNVTYDTEIVNSFKFLQ